VGHTYNPNTQNAEEGESLVQGQLGVHNEILSQKQQNRIYCKNLHRANDGALKKEIDCFLSFYPS
jgi:hypothetical protein